MKALLSRRCGGPENLVMADVPEPEPAAGQVRIAVRACGINYPDVLMIEDKYQFRPERPFSPGVEISGVIDSVAEDVAGFEPGQRVMASIPCGGPAELGRALGARVLAAVSSVEKAEVALRHGATDALVYPESPERNRLRSVAS